MTERENKFLTLLMGKCWHEWEKHFSGIYYWTCKHCGLEAPQLKLNPDLPPPNPDFSTPEGFFEAKEYMESHMPEMWIKYLAYINKITAYKFGGLRQFLKDVLNLSNLVAFLIQHKEEWGWVECPDCKGTGRSLTKRPDPYPFVCETCHMKQGKIKHPALVGWKEEG